MKLKETVCASIPDPPAVGNSGRIGKTNCAPVAAVRVTLIVVSGAVSAAVQSVMVMDMFIHLTMTTEKKCQQIVITAIIKGKLISQKM